MSAPVTSPCCVCGRDLERLGPAGTTVNRVRVGEGREACAGCAHRARTGRTMVDARQRKARLG